MGKKEKILTLILLISFLSSSLLFFSGFKALEKPSYKTNAEITAAKKSELMLSGYTDLTGMRICINDRWNLVWPYTTTNSRLHNPNNKTWAEAAATEDWCSGTGTWDDPYIIENVYIDCQRNGSGISIWNSNVPCIIRNNYIYNAGSEEHDCGIMFLQVHNGTITNNTLAYNLDSIWLWESNNNTVSGNIMVNKMGETGGGGKAVKLTKSNNNTISWNNSTNHYDGIVTWDSLYNNISNNFIYTDIFGHYPATGLYLINTNYSRITFNTFAGDYAYPNPYGDSIINQLNCVGNDIGDNFNVNITSNTSTSIKSQSKNLKLQASYSWFNLENSNYNYIYGNRLYIPDYRISLSIPGYDFNILIGLIGITSIIHITINKIKKRR